MVAANRMIRFIRRINFQRFDYRESNSSMATWKLSQNLWRRDRRYVFSRSIPMSMPQFHVEMWNEKHEKYMQQFFFLLDINRFPLFHTNWRSTQSGYNWPPLHPDAHLEYLRDAEHSKHTMCSKGLRKHGMKRREKLLLLFERISDRLLGSAAVFCILTRFVFISFFSLSRVNRTLSNKVFGVFEEPWHFSIRIKRKPHLVWEWAAPKMNGLDLSADEVPFNVGNLFVLGLFKLL